MPIIICDLKHCEYYRENYYCTKKVVDLKNGECLIAKQMKDMEVAIQDLKRAEQEYNQALVIQNMTQICPDLPKFYT